MAVQKARGGEATGDNLKETRRPRQTPTVQLWTAHRVVNVRNKESINDETVVNQQETMNDETVVHQQHESVILNLRMKRQQPNGPNVYE